jgi:hypothetical protein
MSVIRGKLYTDREIVVTCQTIGYFPWRKDDYGRWVHTETGELGQVMTLEQFLKSTPIEKREGA